MYAREEHHKTRTKDLLINFTPWYVKHAKLMVIGYRTVKIDTCVINDLKQ